MSQALYKIDVGSIKNIFLVLSLFSRSAQHTMVRPPMFEIPLKLSCRPGLLVYLFREQCSCRGQLRLSSKFLLWRGVFCFCPPCCSTNLWVVQHFRFWAILHTFVIVCSPVISQRQVFDKGPTQDNGNFSS